PSLSFDNQLIIAIFSKQDKNNIYASNSNTYKYIKKCTITINYYIYFSCLYPLQLLTHTPI
ncbi:hypothetical protein QI923_20020, partial [Clostridioides difficile]|nr:hypothetical protein [Clostridioides difficile]